MDTGRLLPLLAAVYFLVAFLEYRYGDRMGYFMARFGALGPVAGALFGCIPQCGFSVVAAALYVKRLISVGTLLAVFLSTSDEAIPVLLSMPEQAGTVWNLINIKVLIAIIAGIGLDLLVRKQAQDQIVTPDVGAEHSHSGCCSHGISGDGSKVKALFLHPLWHTVKIALFLFVLTLLMNIAFASIGEVRIGSLLLVGTLFQPFLTTLIGLIPNCFASVFLAGLFAKGIVSFGSLVAGLCAGAGLGLMVLVKENKDTRETLMIVGTLVLVSILAGVFIQLVVAL